MIFYVHYSYEKKLIFQFLWTFALESIQVYLQNTKSILHQKHLRLYDLQLDSDFDVLIALGKVRRGLTETM